MEYLKCTSVAFFLMTGVLVVSSFCSSSRREANDTNTTVNTNDSLHATANAFKAEWNIKLDSLNAEIGRMQQRIKTSSDKEKTKMQQKLDDLKAKQNDLKKEIDAADNKTEAQWDNFKDDVSRKYQNIKDDVSDFFTNENN